MSVAYLHRESLSLTSTFYGLATDSSGEGQFIYNHRQCIGITESLVITPRIINQEKGGVILFVWNDVDKDKPSSFVTNFGIYDPESQSHKVIYTYEKKVKVVSCSLNQERTLLAFSIVKPRDHASDKKSKDVFQGFLAELQSVDKIVYSLNMERSTFLKVQFLYPDQQGQTHSRESSMLVFLHKESIGLYRVPVARIGDRGIMMSGQPKTEQVVRKFVWCQWDVLHQRLHFIQNLRADGGSGAAVGNGAGVDGVQQKMSTIQFYSRGKYEGLIDVPINFPFPYIRTADKPHYGDIPLHPGIPELTLNVAVLTQTSGTFCLCYHKLITEPRAKAMPQAPTDCQDIEYYISMVHHAKTLYGCVSNLPRHVAMQKRLVFSWLGSYLVVMLPGYFVHLLNVSPTFEPCHHLLLHDYKMIPNLTPELAATSTKHMAVKFNIGDEEESQQATKESSLPNLSASDPEQREEAITDQLASPDEPVLATEAFTDSPGQSEDLPDASQAEATRVQQQATNEEQTTILDESRSNDTSPSTATDQSQSMPTVYPIFSEACTTMKTLLPCQSFFRESGSTAQHLYDYRSGCLMKLVMNVDLMVDSFRKSYWQTRLAILHYLILHHKDPYAIKKLFEVLCDNLTSSEVNNMFTEYLVASTFAEMKKQVDREVLNLLSFTSIQTLRGQFEKGPLGERMAHVSYLNLELVDLNRRPSRDVVKRPPDNYWDVLVRRLKMRHSEPLAPRFSHTNVMRFYRQAEMEEASGKTMWDAMHVEDSFFDGVYTMKLTEIPASLWKKQQQQQQQSAQAAVAEVAGFVGGEGAISGRISRLEQVLGPTPLFLQTRIAQESTIFKRRLSMLTEDLLSKHLFRYLCKESRSKANNVAREYLYCQAKVSRQLCRLIWSLRGNHLSHELEDRLLPNLQDFGSDEEYELFQLYERFYLTATELGYPLPPGFSSFFTALGFKCLELHMFFQYVDNHILVLTPDFILQLLEDLPDDADEEIPHIKFQVISRLPKPFAEECFERWKHPITQQRKAREQVTQILQLGHILRVDSSGDMIQQARPMDPHNSRHTMAGTSDDAPFPPLGTLMKHLETIVNNTTSTRTVNFDTHLIEQAALYNTKTKTPFDLSTVNF
ncbi:protein pigeon [Plakobranchus ocellatus]|uniref:Protein pigeon n=1 Tax=Plakobranchus ocellatus TaxID=259542 RepID=A0AAV4DLP3_9GAST|nr:protein pigeon [Plakobranchus ocellatus]